MTRRNLFNPKVFGTMLRRHMLDNGWSCRDVAKKIGYSLATQNSGL